jgi:LysM repeat protein
LHNSRWNASASGEFTGSSFEATASSARDDLKNEDPVVYFIKEGDTLTAIAKRFNTTISRLAGDNGIDNVDILLPGEKLVIHFPSERTRQVPFRAKPEISVATSKMLGKAPAKLVKELNTATTSGYDTAPSYSHVGGFSPVPSGIMAQVIIPLLLIAPVVGFCFRCAVDYIQERIQKEIEAKHAELESYRSRRRPKVNRWQGILDEDRMEALGHEEAAAASAALDDYRFNDEQQIPTGYASIRAMNEDSVANESEDEQKHRHMKDYEDIRKSYAELETTYKKFLLDSGLSRSGYWRGSVTQLQEEH